MLSSDKTRQISHYRTVTHVYKSICYFLFDNSLISKVYKATVVQAHYEILTTMIMFFRTLGLLTMIGWFEIQCYVPVPSIYREADQALRHYSFQPDHNPLIYSLLTILVYDKRAKAFINEQIIEQALNDVQKFNRQDDEILRTVIYGEQSSMKSPELSDELKQGVQLALDVFFSDANVDDYDTFAV